VFLLQLTCPLSLPLSSPPLVFFLCPHVGTSPAHQKFLEEGNADASHWLLENTVYVRLEAGLRKSIVNSIQN